MSTNITTRKHTWTWNFPNQDTMPVFAVCKNSQWPSWSEFEGVKENKEKRLEENLIPLAGIRSVMSMLYPKWHPIPYIVHSFWPESCGSWSKVVHYIRKRVPFGMHTTIDIPVLWLLLDSYQALVKVWLVSLGDWTKGSENEHRMENSMHYSVPLDLILPLGILSFFTLHLNYVIQET